MEWLNAGRGANNTGAGGVGSNKGCAVVKSQRDLICEENALFAVHIVNRSTGDDRKNLPAALVTLCSCVERLLDGCGDQIGALAGRILVADNEALRRDFAAMADELFEADEGYLVSWERIITLFAFSRVLVTHLRDQCQNEAAGMVGKILASYLDGRISDWIRERGGWVKLHEEFSDEEPSLSHKWKLLSLTVLGIGLIASYKLTH